MPLVWSLPPHILTDAVRYRFVLVGQFPVGGVIVRVDGGICFGVTGHEHGQRGSVRVFNRFGAYLASSPILCTHNDCLFGLSLPAL